MEHNKQTEDRHPLEQGQVFLIDKPLGWTSFNVVSRVRNWAHRIVGRRVKTGHAGTLDPLATGLLIVCTGSFTKKIESYQAQVKEYTGTFGLGATTKSHDLDIEVEEGGPLEGIDEARILTEAALFADKTAIDEETVRLHSHVAQFREILQLEEPIGRKLDFLTQELNREANTIGSKCQDAALTRLVVTLKSEIEKIREQIQNIE